MEDMGRINQCSVRYVVDRINESYFVPDIQRSYVWLQNPRDRKIEQLFDSLMRGYPIGSLLFWNLKRGDIEDSTLPDEGQTQKLNFQLYKFIENYDVRHHHNEKIGISQIKNDDLHIVLDGQQRLTSLYIGMRGSRCLRRPYARTNSPDAYETKYLHLNLQHRPKDDNPEDHYQFEFKTVEEAVNDVNANWFRLSKALDFRDVNALREYCKEHSVTDDEKDMLSDFWMMLNDNTNIAYFEEDEKNLDKVLKIFIRVNSGGTQLSYSDLLMSLLTATFKGEIREKMEQEVDYLADVGFRCVGRDQILKTCLLLSGCSHIFKLENFSKANIRKIEENWDAIIKSLNCAVNLISSFGYKDQLTSGYIVTTIAHYLFHHQNNYSEEDKEAMVYFVRLAQIRSFFSTTLDTKLNLVRDLMNGAPDFVSFLKKAVSTLEDLQMPEDRLRWYIDYVQYGNGAVLPLLQILYPYLNYSTTTFHIDHIFPKSRFNDKNEKLPAEYMGRANFLYNLQLLEGSANESKKAKDPGQWLQSITKTDEERRAYLKQNYIPEDFKLEWENLPEFAEKRSALMLQQLKKAFAAYSALIAEPESAGE